MERHLHIVTLKLSIGMQKDNCRTRCREKRVSSDSSKKREQWPAFGSEFPKSAKNAEQWNGWVKAI